MRIKEFMNGRAIWLSAKDTYDWAHKEGGYWPCSKLSGKRIKVELANNGDLINFEINGRPGDCDNTELQAILADNGHNQRSAPQCHE